MTGYKLCVSKLFLLFAALPLVDMYLLVRLGKAFGGGLPILIVLASGLAGFVLIRTAGARVIDAWRRALAEGAPPNDNVFSGALMLLGCALFIMPGLISDVLGATLMIPAVRRGAARAVGHRLFDAMQRSVFRVVDLQSPFSHTAAAPQRRDVIDVEGEVVDPKLANDDPRQLKP
jgi:UPF0716 protein FxsA